MLATVASITAERDQLKMDMQENVEMVGYCASPRSISCVLAFLLSVIYEFVFRYLDD